MEFRLLTETQRRQFDEDGFLIVKGALNAEEIGRLIEAGDRLVATECTENRCDYETAAKTDGFRNCIAMDDAFIPLLCHGKTVPLIVQLLSHNIQLATSHLIYKHPNPSGTPATHRDPKWHRDIQGTAQDLGHANIPRMEIKCAYYLTDLSTPNSGVTLMSPGSQKLKHALDIPAGRVDPLRVAEPLLQAGDAILFENRTWHAGGANLSGRIRKTVMFGYCYKWLRPMDFMVQPLELIEKVDEIGKQLLDGLKAPGGKFVPGGINEPLKQWMDQHGLKPRVHEELAVAM
ncbi:MAG TPA: phytanoyl-CoA dioxygenase family protein [Planctomycetota bacterium]|nr:phytanoyl-CoA dioxygenase family protein [Planctomycetota bacterium]